MNLLDLTMPTPAENLALDEALLNWAEEHQGPDILRFWESDRHFVTLGYANKVKEEVNILQCGSLGISILRRCSGGGTVLQGPGSLSYAVVLKISEVAALESITGTNRFVMDKNRQAISSVLGESVTVEGFTDLALSGLKFSGNAQRRKRNYLLFHGTFLTQNADVSLIERCLLPPPRQPEYRRHRSHAEFLTLLQVSAESIKAVLKKAWLADRQAETIPQNEVTRLISEQYGREEWNLRC